MAETTAPAPARFVYELKGRPDFEQLPTEQKLKQILDLAQKDGPFMAMSGVGRKQIIDELLGGEAAYQAQPATPEDVLATQQPLQTPPGLTQALHPTVEAPGSVAQGVRQGLTRGIDEGVIGPFALAYEGAKAVTQPLVEPIMNAMGLEPGDLSENAYRTVFRPLETAQAGTQGFPPLEGMPGVVQDVTRQAVGALSGRVAMGTLTGTAVQGAVAGKLSTRLSNQIADAMRVAPITDALLQGVAGTAGGRVGEAVAGPWGGIVAEMVSALGAQGAVSALTRLRSHAARASGEAALGRMMHDIPDEVLRQHITEAEELQRLLPSLRLTPFQQVDDPRLLAVQQLAEQQHPELGSRLKAWREQNQLLLQQSMAENLGPLNATDPAAATAVEAAREPLRQAKQTEAAARAGEQRAQAQTQAAESDVAALGRTTEEARADLLTRRETTLGQVDQAARANLPAQPLSYAERAARTAEIWRGHYAQQFRQFREVEAPQQARQIDPQGLVQASTADIERALVPVEEAARVSQGEAPTVLRKIRAILAERTPEAPPPPEPSRLLDASGRPIQTTPAPPPPEGTLSMQDLRNIRTTILEEMRSERPGTRDYRELTQLHDAVVDVQNRAVAAAGDPGIATRNAAFNQFYATEMRRFTSGPGEQFLRLRRGASRPDPAIPATQGNYAFSPQELLRFTWAKEPVGGAGSRGGKQLTDFRTLATELRQSPAGLQGLIDFAAQDFYEAAMRPSNGNGPLDPKAMERWLSDHQAKLDAVPELRQAFTGPRQQLQRLREVEADGERLMQALAQQKTAAQEAVGQVRTVAQNATEYRQQAQEGVARALTDWRNTFGAGRDATHAQDLALAEDVLGANPTDLIARIDQMPRGTTKNFALGQLTEPVKDQPEVMRGLRRLLWEQFMDREGGQTEAATLTRDFPLADPDKVFKFLDEYRPWFQKYDAAHYGELRALALGMKRNSLARAEGTASVPTALREMSPFQRQMYRLGVGVPLFGAAHFGAGIPLGMSTLLTGGAYGGTAWLEQLSDNARLRLLSDVLYDPDVTRLMGMMRRAEQVNPTYLRTMAYHTLNRLGLVGGEAAGVLEDEDIR